MTGILVHEWLAPRGGSENVFEVLSETYPDAERWCLWNDSGARFEGVNETWLARTPLRRSKAASLPLMPAAWRSLPSRDAEWVLCSSHLFAHHARFRGPAGEAPKLVYAHTPARYVWVPELDGRGNNPAARTLSSLLKPLDRKRAQEPVAIAANSRFVADRIAATWERESTVIYPPVDVELFMSEPELSGPEQAIADALPSDFLLGVSRFVPYKRLDRVIEAGAASGMRVVLAGSGPDGARLRALADDILPGGVTFVEAPSRELLRALYRRASALVFAPIEDFGIIPVEAMASGTPVIANAIGGAAESVVDGATGALVREWSSEELRAAIERALRVSADACAESTLRFTRVAFGQRVREWLSSTVGESAGRA
jgi:glycosyltransferase involved in cell wall biosynthesis